jgi:site-specific recombinase XerD
MDTVNYQAKVQALLGYLSSQSYCDKYVSVFRVECDRVLDYLSSSHSLDGYFEGYHERYGVEPLPYRRKFFRLIRSYLECGRLPSRRHPLRGGKSGYGMLPEDIRRHVDSYVASCGSGWSSSTCKTVRQTVSLFLSYLQKSGAGMDAVTESDVWAYFYDSGRDVALRGHICSYHVRRFLGWAGSRPGGEHYLRILPMVPAMRHAHKVFDCLSADEDGRLVSYILGNDCRLSLRDRAIVAVARFCGLRACDIAALHMENVDLGHSRLTVWQHKTGLPLEQALRPVVGNAICRYVMEERPETDLPEVFLVDEREVRPLAPSTVGKVCDRAYRLAGIRQEGRCRGSHLLRHRFAQSLVDAGVCDSAAMRLLGHASPASLNVYLEADEHRLRECALSISCFKIGKEVLA